MRNFIARLSLEGRVKLIIICLAAFTAILFIFTVRAYSEDVPEPPGRTNLIRTSYSTDNYSVFECSGSTVAARGRYTPDRVRRLYIDKYEEYTGSYSMNASEDGSYNAELSMKPEKGEHLLVVQLSSGALMKYRIYYNDTNGWYFPVNGLDEQNRGVFDHIFDAPAEASALYLSPSADAGEINTALEQIELLTETVTGGIEDDYSKARAISRFISEKVYYDFDAAGTDADLGTIALCNVLKNSRTVCGGFANLFCAMAEAAGLDAVNIKGGVTHSTQPNVVTYAQLGDGRQNHEWAAFYYPAEERWVWVDACWDGAGDYKGGEWKPGKPKYMYFDISDEAFSLNHRADKAERRLYFSAKTETEPLEVQTEAQGEPLPEITSQVTEPALSETAPATSEFHPQPGEVLPETSVPADTPQTEVHEQPAENSPDTVLILIIAALAAGIAVVAVILINILRKRKDN